MVEAMIDLETYGLPPKGLPISIGAVKFDADDMCIVDRFHICIDPETVTDLDFTIHPGTVKWWMMEDRDDAREIWLQAPKFDMGTALAGFLDWFGPSSMPVWGNAATFDIVILAHAFKTMRLPCPWKFWDERCHRTLKTLAPEPVTRRAFETGLHRAGSGVLHTALVDAEVQSWQNMLLRAADPRYAVENIDHEHVAVTGNIDDANT